MFSYLVITLLVKKWRKTHVRNKNFSSWAEDINLDDLNSEAQEYDLPLDVLEDACSVLNRSTGRYNKKGKPIKRKKECWQ